MKPFIKLCVIPLKLSSLLHTFLMTSSSTEAQKEITFEDLNLSDQLITNLYDQNYEKPSQIQSQALPLLLSTPFTLFTIFPNFFSLNYIFPPFYLIYSLIL